MVAAVMHLIPAEPAAHQHLRRARAPREMRAVDWPALSIVTSGLAAALARWSEAAPAADVAQPEAPAWERETASATLARFCAAHPATRVAPSLAELEGLWQRCVSLRPAALTEALAEQLVCEDGEIDWRRHLRALHAANHFFARGGAGEAAARPALEAAEGLLRHLAGHVPQCAEPAARALAHVFGEEAAGPEAAAGGGPELPPPASPQRQDAWQPQAAAPVPRLAVPRPPSTSVARPAPQAAATPCLPDLVLPISPPAVAVGPSADSDAEVAQHVSAESDPPPEEQLGFHWLDKARIDSAVPKDADPFSQFAMAAQTMAGVEGI